MPRDVHMAECEMASALRTRGTDGRNIYIYIYIHTHTHTHTHTNIYIYIYIYIYIRCFNGKS